MVHPLIGLIVFLLIALIVTAFGARILSWLKASTTSLLEKIVFGYGIGSGVLSIFVLAIGLMHFLYAWMIIILLVLMAAISIKEIISILHEITHGLRFRVTLSNLVVCIGMVMLAGLSVIPALAPSSGMDWDGLSYHLAIPKIYLKNHAIVHVPYISHSNFPFLTEMLYTVGLAFNSQATAKLFHYAMYLATVCAIFALCKKYLSATAGIIASFIYMSTPLVAWEAGVAYADLSTAFYIILALYAIFNWERSGISRWLIIAGIVCGFAFSTKVIAAIPIILLCLLILLICARSHGWRIGLKYALITGLIAVFIGSPWYIKSYVFTGNPFYPFLYEIFGGRYWSKEAADAYRGSQLAFGMGRGVWQLIMLPWNLTMNGIYFFDIPDPRSPKIWGSIGMAFLGLLPVSIPLSWNNRLIKRMVIISVIFVVTWFFMMQYSRYLITIIPIVSIIAGYGVCMAASKLKMSKYALYGFLMLCILMGILNGYLFSRESAKAAIGIEKPENFLARTLDVYPAEAWINENTPQNARVAVFDEVRCFYLDREYIWANPGHHEMIPWKRMRDYNDMMRYFLIHGYDYFLINMRFASPSDAHVGMINEMVSDGAAEVLFNQRGIAVLKLKNEKAKTSK